MLLLKKQIIFFDNYVKSLLFFGLIQNILYICKRKLIHVVTMEHCNDSSFDTHNIINLHENNNVDSQLIISHIDTDGNIQSNEEHQQGVAKLASQFGGKFDMGDLCYIMGLLHDKGKEQKQWQKYIRYVTGQNNDGGGYNHPNHAYVGACMAQKTYPEIAPLIAQPIAGHHRGLYDYDEYVELMKAEIPNDVTMTQKMKYHFPNISNVCKYDYHHIVRMLFSCLVDADSLDTESFMSPVQAKLRGNNQKPQHLLEKLEAYLYELRKNAPKTEVNSIRNYVQEQCIKASQKQIGFYSLTVPTGGGKTLSSVLWALHHAVKNDLQRIIIAIPYTSIVVQTADTLKRIFGEENVLEHHSNFDPEQITSQTRREQLQLATENWNYPIIVTTNVQLFESLFSNKRSQCRKLHNIAKSVIILDEVQTLPLGFYKPIVNTLDTLQRVFGVSVLFTTASQPILSGRIDGCNPTVGFDALPDVHEIIPKGAELHDKLRRVNLEFIDDSKTYDDVATELIKHPRVLCIVNTRKDAKELYERLPDEGLRLHLSRMMCPAHISATIQQIKESLKSDSNEPIRVIATQLIEAGVDVDFPTVYRQEAGLDSILQAAGRCNREGRNGICTTYVFNLRKEHPLPSGFISQTNNARLNMGTHHDWFSPEAMECYFHHLHSRVDNFDVNKMADYLYKMDCEFEEAAHQFKLIDDNSISVIINWGNSMDLYQQLLLQGPSYLLMKKLAQYSINIREKDFMQLKKDGAIEETIEDIFFITNPNYYKTDTGLVTSNQWLEETFII